MGIPFNNNKTLYTYVYYPHREEYSKWGVEVNIRKTIAITGVQLKTDITK